MKVFGIDVITGSVRSRSRRPRYALVVVSGNEITEEAEVTGFSLFRRLAQEKPDILAVDRLKEVAADTHDIF
jgi:predicted RNase H-like nuclease (RuvC/YqgF family)